jgi:multidrug efflux pump subunit AcrA (membrane-fusion protein)
MLQEASMIRFVGRYLPTSLVLGMLVGLGVYGHQSGWRLPKFSRLVGTEEEKREDWCREHAVPETQCVECNPALLPRVKDHGWCKEHEVHNCPLEHPEIAQLKRAPAVSKEDRQRAAGALAVADRPRSNGICKNYRRRIQFASIESMKKAGVEVAIAGRRPMSESIPVDGVIGYDQTRLACLSSRLPGTIWRIERNVGDRVRSGEVLALVDAAEVGRAKTELIQALARAELQGKIVRRLAPASAQGSVPEHQIERAQAERVEAQARLLGARQALGNLGLHVDVEGLRGLTDEQLVEHLRWLGLPESIAARPTREDATANLLPLKAPMDGVVVARQAVAGEVVDSSRVLFQVADTSRMWLTLSVPPQEAGRLAVGQPVRFLPDGSRDEVSGTLAWISTTADEHTRLVKVRAELPNPKGLLRSETFGKGRIILRAETQAIAVPNEAVQWEGCCRVVFVRDKGFFEAPASPKVFHVREVRVGARDDRHTEIIVGVLPGEVVAAKGSDVLRAELLKNNLGEGCCAE